MMKAILLTLVILGSASSYAQTVTTKYEIDHSAGLQIIKGMTPQNVSTRLIFQTSSGLEVIFDCHIPSKNSHGQSTGRMNDKIFIPHNCDATAQVISDNFISSKIEIIVKHNNDEDNPSGHPEPFDYVSEIVLVK